MVLTVVIISFSGLHSKIDTFTSGIWSGGIINLGSLSGSAPWRRCLCRISLMEHGGPWKC
jgi:hypothetical protein